MATFWLVSHPEPGQAATSGPRCGPVEAEAILEQILMNGCTRETQISCPECGHAIGAILFVHCRIAGNMNLGWWCRPYTLSIDRPYHTVRVIDNQPGRMDHSPASPNEVAVLRQDMDEYIQDFIFGANYGPVVLTHEMEPPEYIGG